MSSNENMSSVMEQKDIYKDKFQGFLDQYTENDIIEMPEQFGGFKIKPNRFELW